ncbi:hypothetical protein [Leisingera thetidis]|uniref:hypothetical protein n=1 Tax=Leisingera thetidis TaxID=2930199 RepID=UPI0021F6A6A9|nr:hypothetical protein [Leisingera thetidis]
MRDDIAPAAIEELPILMTAPGCFAIFGCATFVVTNLAADFVVAEHDRMAGTICDLAAGRFAFWWILVFTRSAQHWLPSRCWPLASIWAETGGAVV